MPKRVGRLNAPTHLTRKSDGKVDLVSDSHVNASLRGPWSGGEVYSPASGFVNSGVDLDDTARQCMGRTADRMFIQFSLDMRERFRGYSAEQLRSQLGKEDVGTSLVEYVAMKGDTVVCYTSQPLGG